MGGGLLQLVAYGAQDVYLTGNPQITFFKVVYRRHTNFAIEAIQQTFNGNPNFGNRVTCQISRNGDLIHRMYLAVETGTIANAVRYFGLRLIDYVELEIGGQKIDKQYSHWMYIWNELSLPKGKQEGYKNMVGGNGGDISSQTLYIPLEFWFCRNVGLALPLIALQYHEVKVNIQLETGMKCSNDGNAISSDELKSVSLWVDYIFLDTDERRRFAQLSHEYLIEQLQFTGSENLTAGQTSTNTKTKLSFNHPCKELYWFVTNTDNSAGKANTNWFNYSLAPANAGADVEEKFIASNGEVSSNNPVITAKLVLNGNDRSSERPGSYINLIQPYQHHENIPENAGINVYSFALKPEEHQPSGSLNMSRIDTATLNINAKTTGLTATKLNVYAVNYNVLRILSGMGGLAYSN